MRASAIKRALVALAVGGLAVVGLSQPAQAINQYVTIGNVPKPAAACNNHGVMPAGGWLANKSCGYVMGTAIAGTRFDVSTTTPNNFHFGRWRAGDGSSFCAYLVPGALNTSHSTPIADSCSSATSDRLVHRRTFGRDFDVAPHTGNGAIVVRINPSACTGYYNYFTDSTYTTGALRDPAGFALPTTGGYRYTTADNGASMIRVDALGETIWLFVSRACINAQLPANLNNQND
ncbi:hypothetical protein [Streptomyces sp. SID13031]|uniref:hypothetical protein n=1 Tax=Streptomyces sp. SID13031 TaxID=2706046 RepID=UPI0013CD7D0D|nr:hypothetical protein [Streptomyces sp. SID13031]NEA37185.1 hypothetical protein [Streptomyces sp. SID13031]